MTVIFSIGYGNRKFDDFIRLLQTYGITYLIDVRSQPFSQRNPDFSKDRLSELSRKQGIQYVWMGESLGGRPKDPECYTSEGKVDYEKCATMDFYKVGIVRLQNALSQQLNVVLMCSEVKPQECHRSKLIGETLRKAGISVIHIDENGKLKPQEILIKDLISSLQLSSPNQLSLFDDNSIQPPKLTSRKSYMPQNKREDDKNDT